MNFRNSLLQVDMQLETHTRALQDYQFTCAPEKQRNWRIKGVWGLNNLPPGAVPEKP